MFTMGISDVEIGIQAFCINAILGSGADIGHPSYMGQWS